MIIIPIKCIYPLGNHHVYISHLFIESIHQYNDGLLNTNIVYPPFSYS